MDELISDNYHYRSMRMYKMLKGTRYNKNKNTRELKKVLENLYEEFNLNFESCRQSQLYDIKEYINKIIKLREKITGVKMVIQK